MNVSVPPGSLGSEVTVGEIIRNAMDRLTKSERQVARILLAGYPVAGLETVTELAERAGVSGPTVIRLTSKLGFHGYPEFQRALRDELQTRLSSPLALYQRRPAGEGAEDILRSSCEVFVRDVDAAFHHVSPTDFGGCADLLADKRYRVRALGGRFSQILAYYLVAHLHSLRPGTELIGFGPAPRGDDLLDTTRRDVLAVFDYRRYQEDTVRAARIAADRGATVVLFTDPWLSPAAEVARYVLTAPVDAPSPFDSFVGPLAVIEALLAAVTIRLGESARQRMARLDEVRGEFLRERGGVETDGDS